VYYISAFREAERKKKLETMEVIEVHEAIFDEFATIKS